MHTCNHYNHAMNSILQQLFRPLPIPFMLKHSLGGQQTHTHTMLLLPICHPTYHNLIFTLPTNHHPILYLHPTSTLLHPPLTKFNSRLCLSFSIFFFYLFLSVSSVSILVKVEKAKESQTLDFPEGRYLAT